MLKRILIPLDGSETAEAALTQMRHFLKRQDSEVVLARIVEPLHVQRMGELSVPEEVRREARSYLEKWERRLSDEGVRVRSVLGEGSAADELLKLVEQERATLIAMTTHGRTGLSRWVFGSVAEKMLRASRVPLFLLRSFEPGGKGALEPAAKAERAFQKILVPTDGGKRSLTALPYAIGLARLFNSSLVFLHVRELPLSPPGSFAGMVPAWPLASAAPPDEPTPESSLASAVERAKAEGIKTESHVVSGDPASEIVNQSASHKADLIVMATHARQGVSRWVLGSVTEKVLRAATVPMLVVRTEGSA
ncbi:MAG: universal stress protein [Planctomycetes bacterium]|nr:universal stress protein [Planctomycetota bacterium]